MPRFITIQPRVFVLCAVLNLIASAGEVGASWDLPSAEETGIVPRIGSFSFDESGSFDVVQGERITLRFSRDGFRFDSIDVVDGAFRHTHGEIGGTHCPTDSYGISGAFVAPSRAEGTIIYARACQVRSVRLFVAEICAEPECIEVSSIPELRVAIVEADVGAAIRLAPGVYTVSETIDIARDDLTVEGSGNKATKIRLAENSHEPLFVIGEPTPFAPTITRRNITLRNLVLDGTWELQSDSSHCPGQLPECSNAPRECSCTEGREFLRNNCVTVRQATDVLLEDLVVESCASGGIIAEQQVQRLQIRRVEASKNRFDGVAWDGDISGSFIVDSVLHSNLAAGLSLDLGPRGNQFVNLEIRDNGRAGVFVSDSDGNHFENCDFSRNGEDGVFVRNGDAPGADSRDNIFEGCRFVANERNGFWLVGDDSVGNKIEGSEFRCNGDEALVHPEGVPVDGENRVLECLCKATEDAACLGSSRFSVSVDWRAFDNSAGPGKVVNASDDSAVFWFFNRRNWELDVKLIDGCDFNGHFWVFGSASTDVSYTITVLDTETGQFKQYSNPLGNQAAAITDTEAFQACEE